MKTKLLPLAAALVAPAVLFLLLPPLGHAGLWDPHEIRVAELARGQVDAGAQPPLALLSIGLGFRLFGVHEWAGRLPLALYGVLGVAATYAWVARLVDRRAGVYAAVALFTMPLFFVQARTMLGGVVGMTAVTAAFGGLAVATFDRTAKRIAWLALAAVALAAGFGGAGALLGVAVPAVAVGAAWALVKLARARAKDTLGDVVGAASLGVGAMVAALAIRAVATHGAHEALLAGASPVTVAGAGFARVLARLGHALAPWSAFVPLALGRLFVAPEVEDPGARERESNLRVALLVAAGAALAAHTWLAAAGVDVPFVGPAVLAASCAVALRDFERGAPPSIILGVAAALLLGVLFVDFRTLPDETLAPFGVVGAQLPDGFRTTAQHAWAIALGVFAVFALVTWIERDESARSLFDRARIERTARAASGAWDGNAGRVYLAATAGACFAALGLFFGMRLHQRWAMGVAAPVREGLSALAVALVVLPPLLLVALPLACDAAAWLSRRVLGGRRGALLVVGGLASGLVLSVWQYPALAAQLSPKGALEAYAHARRDGEPLALLGVSERAMTGNAVAYATGATGAAATKPEIFADADHAYAWLSAAPERQRRFLLAGSASLPALNQIFRQRSPAPHRNAPVLDARSSDALLVASSLLPGDTDENPWSAFTLTATPSPQHALSVDLSGQVEILGWDLSDEGGARVDGVVPGHKYQARVYLRVDKRPTTAWQALVHVDGDGRRHNADHPLVGGKYPPTSWEEGDLLVDVWELALPPNFTGGAYRLYYGFWLGDARLPVTRGPSDGVNRVDFGELRVR